MKLHAIWAIGINTFRETVRDRVLYAFVVFAIVLTLAGILLGSLSVNQNVRVLEDLGMLTISTIGGVIAIFVGTNLVYKELDKRTIYLILTKPIARSEFIVGKFVGLALCLLAVTAMMGGFLMATVYCYGISQHDVQPPFNAGREMLAMLESLGLLYVELLLLNAIATFFSTFATPLMSMIFTLGLWVCGHMAPSLLALAKLPEQSAATQTLFTGVYYVLPDLAKLTQIRFDLLTHAGSAPMPSLESIMLLIAYVFFYVVLLLSFATIVTERREFS